MNITDFDITALNTLQLTWLVLATLSSFIVVLMTARLVIVGIKWSLAAALLLLVLSPLRSALPDEDFTLTGLLSNAQGILENIDHHTSGVAESAYAELKMMGLAPELSPRTHLRGVQGRRAPPVGVEQ